MELYQLRTFITVAEEGHLTRAAERLHTSQPSLSAHIKALEDELGLLLFERTAKGMKLTHAGSALQSKAYVVLKDVDAIRFEAPQLKNELGGAMRIGLNVNPRLLKVTEMLVVMRNIHPGVEMHYRHRMTWEAPDDLLADSLDAGFVYSLPESHDICAEHLDAFDLMVVGPMAWRQRLENDSWKEILSLPWIWTDARCPFHAITARLFAEHGCQPDKAVVADEDSTIKNLVASGVGIGLMTAAEAHVAAGAGELFIVRREPVATIPLFFIYLCRRAEDPMIQAILNCIRQVWRGRMATLATALPSRTRQQTA